MTSAEQDGGAVSGRKWRCPLQATVIIANNLKSHQCALTGDGDVSVGFSLVDDVHHLVGTGNKTLRAPLTGSTHPVTRVAVLVLTSARQRTGEQVTLTKGTLFLSSWTARLVLDTET